MQNRLSVLSIALFVMITSAGCWRKKCCKTVTEEINITRTIEETPCNNCPVIVEDEVEQFVDEEFPAASEHIKERVSGHLGWKQGDLK